MRNRNSIIYEKKSYWENRLLNIKTQWLCKGIWSLSFRESWLIANKPQTIKILKWLTRLSRCAGITKAWTKMAASRTYRTKRQMKIYISNITNNTHSNSRCQSSTGHTAKTNSSNTAIREHSSNRNTKKICHTKLTLLKWHNQISIKMMQASHNSIFSWILSSSKWQTSSETYSLWPSHSRSRRTYKNRYHHQATLQGTQRVTFHQFHRKEMYHTTSENSQSMEPVDHITTETKQSAHKIRCSTTGPKAKLSPTANAKPWWTRMHQQVKAPAATLW